MLIIIKTESLDLVVMVKFPFGVVNPKFNSIVSFALNMLMVASAIGFKLAESTTRPLKVLCQDCALTLNAVRIINK